VEGSAYAIILFIIHIGGAIIGLGPTFAFAVLGPLAGKTGGPMALGMLQGMVAIEKKLVRPVAFFTQPVSGVLLIFHFHLNEGFFNHPWLWISILLFAAAIYIATFSQTPRLEKMVELAMKGEFDTPEFAALTAKTQKMGPFLGIFLVIIIILMIWKPGG
jgi:uncharacterized membrane protein